MRISKISGVDYNIITSIGGISKENISSIGGTIVPPIITCEEIKLRYNVSQDAVCRSSDSTYFIDESTATNTNQSMGTLYSVCGSDLAPIGFYSNGTYIYEWDGISFIMVSSCRR
jgi:hypothetical protein